MKFVALACLLLLGSFSIMNAIFASMLTPPTKPEQWFLPGHMLQSASDKLVDSFLTGDDDACE